MVDWRTKLSILWLIHVIGGIYNVVLELFRDGSFSKLEGFPITDAWLLVVSVMYLAPLLMAFFTQVLADKTARLASMAVGSVFAAILAVDLAMSVALDPSVLAINSLFAVIWSVLIVWTAWKSK